MNLTRLFEREQRCKNSNLFNKPQPPQTNMIAGGLLNVSELKSATRRYLRGKGVSATRDPSNRSTKVAYPISYAAAQDSEQNTSMGLLDGKQSTPCVSTTGNNQSLGDCRRTHIVNVLFKINYGKRRSSKQKSKVATDPGEQSFILVRKDDRSGTKLKLSVLEDMKEAAALLNQSGSQNPMPICTVESKLMSYQPAKQYLRAERARIVENKLRQPLKVQNNREPTRNPVLSINRVEEQKPRDCPVAVQEYSPQKNTTVEDLIRNLNEEKRMLATSLNNHSTTANEYIIKRRVVNKKDYFVFGMEARANCENKLGLYRDFLWKVNYSNGLLVEPLLDYQYKVYVGRGNNCQLIRALLKRRFWWTFVDKLTDDVNLVWTQLKVTDFYEKQQEDFRPESPPVKKSLKKSQSATHCSLGFLETTITTATKNFSSDSEPVQSPKKIKASFVEEKKEDAHSYIFSDADLSEWRLHYSRHKQLEERLEEKVYMKRTSLLRMKCAAKIEQPIQLRVQNHFAFNYFIGNKKAMFYSMRKYYEVTGQNVFDYLPLTFHISRATEDPEYKKFLQFYEEFRSNRRQSKSQNVWIVKPGEFTNRGHGITVCETLEDIIIRLKGREKNANGKLRTFIVQKYLERPFLYFRRKFDIRHYMMITCINGKFKGYWYSEGYIRTTSFEYSVKNCRDNLVHLTNDAVQKYCPQYGKYEKGNKLSYADFQKYLDQHYRQRKLKFQQQVLPQMRRIATDAVKSCYHLLDPGRRPHNFEVFGMDFMIDEDFKPWLIEINTNPCLELACPLLARIIPSMLENAFKLTIDPLFQPPLDWPANKKYQLGDNPLENNRFSLIFDEETEGADIQELYRNVDRIDKNMGDIEQEDAEYEDEGGEWNQEQLPPA